MSVIVLGMEMPENCHVCGLCFGGLCYAMPPEVDEMCPDEDRPDWCPLRPLPENHGRLLDENEIREAFGMGKDCALCKQDIRDCQYNPIFTRMEFCGAIDDMKTIIVAEGET